MVVCAGVATFCEWLIKFNGQIATCVESSEMMVDALVKAGFPCDAQEDTALTQDLINRGEASANGATNYLAAAEQMTRLGIPNTAYGADWFAVNDFVPVVKASLDKHIPALFGLYAAFNLHDDFTNAPEDAGVYGHGICLVGYDGTGAIAADPNTSQALHGDLVHYTWADLKAAGGQFPSMVIPEGRAMATPLDGDFTQNSDGSWTLKNNAQIVLAGGELALFQQLGGATGLPASAEDYGLQAKYHDSAIAFRHYERAVMLYDPNHVKDAQPGFGAFMLGHIDDPDFAVDPGAVAAATAALQAEVSSLQQQLTHVQSTLSQQAHDALTAVAALKTALAD